MKSLQCPNLLYELCLSPVNQRKSNKRERKEEMNKRDWYVQLQKAVKGIFIFHFKLCCQVLIVVVFPQWICPKITCQSVISVCSVTSTSFFSVAEKIFNSKQHITSRLLRDFPEIKPPSIFCIAKFPQSKIPRFRSPVPQNSNGWKKFNLRILETF